MNKNEYVAGNEFEAFVAWMSAHLDDATFAHAYTLRRGNTAWDCASLFEAYERYDWGHVALPEYSLAAGSDFTSNMRVLEIVQRELRAGLATGDNERVFIAAKAVMKWGGVTRGNVEWLEAWRDDLCRIIGETRDAINAGDTRHPLFAQSELRFTSGMSKVYALVCDDFAIYDSRVAAALCRAVVLFCRETGLERVPAGLTFPWAAARSSPNADNPPRRNATQDGYTFPRLVRGRAYAVWNMKASWLLGAIVSHRSTRDSAFARLDSNAQRLRALEAALFMYGYDLVEGGRGARGGGGGGVTPVTPVMPGDPRSEAAATVEDDWVQCKTGAQEVPFEYRLAPAPDGVHARNPDGGYFLRFTDEELNSTLQILLDEFHDRPFPLANNVAGVPAGTVPMGLGTAFWRATGRSAGYTSRLAAVLESIGLFKPCSNPPNAGRQWSLDIETLDVDRASPRANVRPYLDAVIQGD